MAAVRLRGGKEEDGEAEEFEAGGTLATTSASSCGAEEAWPCSSMSKVIFLEAEGSLVPRLGVGLLPEAASSATRGGGREEGRREVKRSRG